MCLLLSVYFGEGFDVDHLINYALIVSSEGDVTIYDIEKAIQSEILITNS